MGKAQKVKGSRIEREFAHLINGSRIPLSGAAKHLGQAYTGDVVGMGMTWECKARKDGFKQLYAWLSESAIDALAVKADRKPWLVCLPLETFLTLMNRNEKVKMND
jgi:hypothetical protein